MLPSEKLAIAAHLHVLLRRKTGRVTDTEWMASNADYAAEIVRFAKASAQKDGHADLAEWAARLEGAMTATPPTAPLAKRLFSAAEPAQTGAPAAPGEAALAQGNAPSRYIRGIR
ncbi:MAG TPA: hypothetical protein PLN82_06900 [Rhodoferax sp.]|nr:hypothetical protein [Rhodoferax sp.]